MSERLLRSPFLQVIASNGGYVAYHSLFGNLCRVNAGVVNLLERFREPKRPADVVLGASAAAGVRKLREMWYLVPEGTDERARVGRWLQRRSELVPQGYFITEVELSVSDLCNYSCSYCFADAADKLSDDRRRLSAGPKLMTLDLAVSTVERLLALVRRNRHPRLFVKFVGREPLMNRDVMLAVMDRFGNGKDGVSIRYDVTTNCSLVTEDLARHLKRHGAVVNASMDAPGAENDLTRRTKGGKGTFAEVDRGIGILRDHGIEMILNSVLTDSNFDSLSGAIVDYAAGRGIGTVSLIPVFGNDELALHRGRSIEAIADRLAGVFEHGRGKGVKVRGYWYNGVAKLLWARNRDYMDTIGDRHSCVASGNQINVEPSGDVFPCRMSGARLGHIDDLDALLGSEVYRRYLMRAYVAACANCSIEGFCHGLCVGHLEGKYNDIYRVDEPYCELYRAMTRRVLAHLQGTGAAAGRRGDADEEGLA